MLHKLSISFAYKCRCQSRGGYLCITSFLSLQRNIYGYHFQNCYAPLKNNWSFLCQIHFFGKHFMEQGSYTPAYNFCRPGNGDTCFNFIKTLFKIRFDWTTKFPYPKQTMKTQITMLLTTLAIFDILFLFCTFPLFSLQAMMHFKNFLNLCVYKG